MSALARFYLHEGWRVTGSDLAENANTRQLVAEGAEITYHQSPENLTTFKPDVVIYTDGVTPETTGWAELVAARDSGIETLSYFEALGKVTNEYYVIAVAGTHGKTTTTAMLADILEEASLDPTVIVGSLRQKTKSNFRPGKSKYFLVEADEFKAHFLHLRPDIAIITNIDHDHVDFYPDLAAVQATFRAFVELVPEDGVVIANVTDAHVVPVLEELACEVIDYRPRISLTLPMTQPGLHNRQNAAAAGAAAAFLGVEDRIIDTSLEHFAGTWRRFEYKGDVHGAKVYDDYAHNPQKVAAALAGAREVFPQKKLVAVFEGHTYSRTQELLPDFATALTAADIVLVAPVYAARERDEGKVDAEKVAAAIAAAGGTAEAFYTLDAVTQRAKELADADTVILVMGAGPVTKVATNLTKGDL